MRLLEPQRILLLDLPLTILEVGVANRGVWIDGNTFEAVVALDGFGRLVEDFCSL